MSDQYEQVRSLPFPALAVALGLDMARFKRRKARMKKAQPPKSWANRKGNSGESTSSPLPSSLPFPL